MVAELLAWRQILALALLAAGVVFYVAGSIGLLRFPDAPSRLHALAKADNVGLGLVSLAATLYWAEPAIAAKIALVWLFAIIASGMTAQLLARAAPGAGRSGRRADDERESGT